MKPTLWTIALGAVLYCTAVSAFAASFYTHIYINLQARDHVTDPVLRQLLTTSQQDLVNGSAHPDAGYIGVSGIERSDELAEGMHWPPFHQAYADMIKERCVGRLPGDGTCEAMVAHLMGVVGHSATDNFYDWLFHDTQVHYYDCAKLGDDQPFLVQACDSGSTSPDAENAFLLLHTPGVSAIGPSHSKFHADDIADVFGRMNRYGGPYTASAVGLMNSNQAALGDLIVGIQPTHRYPWLENQWRTHPGGADHLPPKIAKIMDFYWAKVNGRNASSGGPEFFPDEGQPGLLQITPGGHERHALHVLFDRPVNMDMVKGHFTLRDASGNHVAGAIVSRGDRKDGIEYGYIARFVPRDALQPDTEYTATLGAVQDMWGEGLPASSYTAQVRTGLPYNIVLMAQNGQYVRAESAGGRGIRADAGGPNLHESFNLVPLADGKWGIRSLAGHALSAVESFDADLRFKQFDIRAAEKFEVLALGGNTLAFRCTPLEDILGPQFIQASNGGGAGVDCFGPAAEGAATFRYEAISPLVGGNGGHSFAVLAPASGRHAEAIILRGSAGAFDSVGIRHPEFVDDDGIRHLSVDEWRAFSPTHPLFREVEARLPVSHTTYANKATICLGMLGPTLTVYHISIETNTGQSISIGPRTTACEVIYAPAGMRFDGFVGASGVGIERIGFVLRANAAPYTNWNWARGEPPNAGSDKHCAHMGSDGYWYAEQCAVPLTPACRNGAGNWALDHADSWDQARCVDFGGFAAPRDATENDQLRQVMQSRGVSSVWLNISDRLQPGVWQSCCWPARTALLPGSLLSSAGPWLTGWCSHSGATFGTADFDGDGKADVWCHDPTDGTSPGQTWVARSTGSALTPAGVWLTGWCSHRGATFGTADVNGDGSDDAWCHDPTDGTSPGQTWVALSSGHAFTPRGAAVNDHGEVCRDLPWGGHLCISILPRHFAGVASSGAALGGALITNQRSGESTTALPGGVFILKRQAGDVITATLGDVNLSSVVTDGAAPVAVNPITTAVVNTLGGPAAAQGQAAAFAAAGQQLVERVFGGAIDFSQLSAELYRARVVGSSSPDDGPSVVDAIQEVLIAKAHQDGTDVQGLLDRTTSSLFDLAFVGQVVGLMVAFRDEASIDTELAATLNAGPLSTAQAFNRVLQEVKAAYPALNVDEQSAVFVGVANVAAKRFAAADPPPANFDTFALDVAGLVVADLVDIVLTLDPAALADVTAALAAVEESMELLLDDTPPVVALEVSGVVGTNGWFVSDVSVLWTVDDPESAVAIAGCGPATVSQDTGGLTFTCVAESTGGRTVQSVTIMRDATPPTISAVRNHAPNERGWHKQDVEVSFTCGDALAGVASCVGDTTLMAEGVGQGATGSATDQAGNTASATVSGINIDKTPPTITGSRTPPNANGWNNTDVTVSFACGDTLSGLASCSPSQTIATEILALSLTGTAVDLAGNSVAVTVGPINIDKTPPTITAAQSPPANANGWNNTDVTVSFTCSDALSGLAAACPGSTTLTAEGANQTGTGTVTDRAGFPASATRTVNIDKTPPEAANEFDPQVLDLQVVGSDGGSGVEPVVLVSSVAVQWGEGDDEDDGDDDGDDDGQAELRTYRVTDRAGNTLLLVEKVKAKGHEIKATIVSVQYNGGSVVEMPKNKKSFEWSLYKDGSLKELEQKLEAGQGKDKQKAQAKWEAKKNQTTIRTYVGAGDDRGQQIVMRGLVLLRLGTTNGSLFIEF